MALHLPRGMHFAMGVDRIEPLPTDEQVLTRLMADLRLLAAYAQEVAVRLLVPGCCQGSPLDSSIDSARGPRGR